MWPLYCSLLVRILQQIDPKLAGEDFTLALVTSPPSYSGNGRSLVSGANSSVTRPTRNMEHIVMAE